MNCLSSVSMSWKISCAFALAHKKDCCSLYASRCKSLSVRAMVTGLPNVPDVAALRDYLKSLETSYLHQCTRIEQIVVQDNSKAPAIRKRLEKLKACMDDLLNNI